MKSFSSLVAFVAVLAAATALFAPRAGGVAVAATPPPTPPPISGPPVTPAPETSSLPTPSATATLGPLPGMSPRPASKPTPPSDERKGLDGVWEVAIQHPDHTDYTHFAIKQQGDSISGTYLDAKQQKYPLVGTLDGEQIRLIVSLPNGTTLLMEGKLDGTSDMVGMMTTAGTELPFTAGYRAKEKWIENVNPSPGGIGGQSNGGGYTPP